MKYNQNNINENFDLFLNLNLIDTAIELINKERFYGEIGIDKPVESASGAARMMIFSKDKSKTIV